MVQPKQPVLVFSQSHQQKAGEGAALEIEGHHRFSPDQLVGLRGARHLDQRNFNGRGRLDGLGRSPCAPRRWSAGLRAERRGG